MAADYSQVELRIVAALSGDRGLCQAFHDGADIHTATAAKVFGIAPEEVDRGQRSQAKAVNFGILYGQGAFGLAETLKIPRREAKAIIEAYFSEFADLKAYQTEVVERAKELGYVETDFGPKTLASRHHLSQCGGPRLCRAQCHQRPHSRLCGRHHQGGDGPHSRSAPIVVSQSAHDLASAR